MIELAKIKLAESASKATLLTSWKAVQLMNNLCLFLSNLFYYILLIINLSTNTINIYI